KSKESVPAPDVEHSHSAKILRQVKRPYAFIRVIVPGRHNAVSKVESVKPTDFGDFRGEFSVIHAESVFHIAFGRFADALATPIDCDATGPGAKAPPFRVMT